MGGSKCGEAIGGSNGTESFNWWDGIRIEAVARAYRWNKIPNRGGRTLVNGTGYDIAFAKSIQVTILAAESLNPLTGEYQSTLSTANTPLSEIRVDGNAIQAPTVIDVARSSDLSVFLMDSGSQYAESIIVCDGKYTQFQSGTSGVVYDLWSYIPDDAASVTLKCAYRYTPAGGLGKITITTT